MLENSKDSVELEPGVHYIQVECNELMCNSRWNVSALMALMKYSLGMEHANRYLPTERQSSYHSSTAISNRFLEMDEL